LPIPTMRDVPSLVPIDRPRQEPLLIPPFPPPPRVPPPSARELAYIPPRKDGEFQSHLCFFALIVDHSAVASWMVRASLIVLFLQAFAEYRSKLILSPFGQFIPLQIVFLLSSGPSFFRYEVESRHSLFVLFLYSSEPPLTSPSSY